MTHKKLLVVDEVAAELRVSTATVNRLEAEARNGIGNFPLSRQTKPRGKRRWLAADIDAYIASLANANANITAAIPSKRGQTQEYTQRQNLARAILRKHGIER